MTKNFVRISGWPCAPAVARDLVRLLADHLRDMGYELGVNSIYRTKSEQAAIFTSRYGRGARSPWGDYRWYQGAQWGRTSGLGPVASPDVGSNHTRGYAVDFAVSQGSASFQWLVAHGHEYGFNHIEGSGIAEPWHWCWRIGIRPDAATPDPWEGRGAPDPVYASDPGMSLDDIHSGAGGGTEEDDMNDEERKLLREAHAYAKSADRFARAAYKRSGESVSNTKWLVARVKGTVKQMSLTATLSQARDGVVWLQGRVKGSVKNASLTAMIEAILEAVTGGDNDKAKAVRDRAEVIDQLLPVDPDVQVLEVEESPEPVDDEV